MIFSRPLPFREALSQVSGRNVLPTSLTTAELRALGTDIYKTSFVSAQNTIKGLLDSEKSGVFDILSGQTDFATARLAVKQAAQRLGYQPDPDKRDGLQDLSSNKRINLVLRTNVEIAQGQGWDLQGQDPAVLDEWPAQELYRAEDRDKERDWLYRWRLAGDQSGDSIGTGWTITTDGRMIALKNHAIWSLLGSSKLFPDGLDNPFPPFAFSSGMDVKDVDRAEAMAIGLIGRDTQIQPRLEAA